MASTKPILLRVPEDLLKRLHELASPRGRSQFFIESAWREVIRREQIKASRQSSGLWTDDVYSDVPNDVEGTVDYVRALRAAEEPTRQ